MFLLADTWDHRLVDHAVDLGLLTVTAGIVLCMVRVVRGPHLADRALALDTIAVHIVALVILSTLRLDSLMLFDGALVLSLVGFAGTVAVAQYITRRRLKAQLTEERP